MFLVLVGLAFFGHAADRTRVSATGVNLGSYPRGTVLSLQTVHRWPPNEFPMNPAGGEKSGRVEIRIKNGSDVDFDRVRVHFPDQREVDYGPVPKGGVTAFQATSRAYRYAGFSVKAGNQELSLQPIDYVGEQELSPGRYTYSLGVDNGRLTVQLEKVN